MNKTIFLAATSIIFLAAGCTERKFVKTKNGLEYKIIDGSGGKEIKYGNTIEFRAYSYYNDSLMATPFDSVPQLMEIDSTKLPPEYIEIFKAAKKGDSIVTRILVDTIMKFNQVPPFAKKGQFLGYRFKILDVITDPAEADAKKKATMLTLRRLDSLNVLKQEGIDDKILSDYLAKNNITATKTAKGTYVEIQDPGTGAQVENGKAVTVDYKGMTLAGKIFDQSYDSTTGKSVKPFTFMVGQQGAIEGWPDGLVYFKKGGKGRLFIPSHLAYGTRGAGPDIPANTPIMFDISVLDVMPAEDYQKKMMEQQKMMQQMQQQQQQQNPNQGQNK
ncbi:MAG: FKBP-type peptidyl-prolyl cis-trans isomerase [Bacteroidota bacterium]|nr:FKBP-type peptidyl-prolyl cis-trans isomerase [Bacteroidota bacterium]